ncbi:lipopolysaccharide transport system ATP-binding protein [Bosea sp. TND4EK4]|nr:lipopolysaccharide transport system ATP-binding protein [Bosea sp. TND4EK4]
MSKPLAVEFQNVGKMYKLYKDRKHSFIDLVGASKILPFYKSKVDEFWALRDVSFQLEAGSRLGIVGRNGAGKTTLLKLLTGNITPTEGQVTVNGEVQALLEAGAGFHPEFTGYENVEAALTQAGLSRAAIKEATAEITEFTELGEFMNQPFKAYSAGMQARLVFTTATTIKPNILIVDEILGAGDAYFAVKSRQRMRTLVESGASILLVSHSLDQVLQFCDQAIWLERGRVVLRGSSLEVVKAYQEFVHELQDKQIKAANQRRHYGFRDAVEIEHFAETFIAVLRAKGPQGASADISRVELLADGVPVDTVRLGAPQDSDSSQFAYVALNTGNWQSPRDDNETPFRSLKPESLGELVFRTLPLDPKSRYSFRVHYRCTGEARLSFAFSRNGRLVLSDVQLPASKGGWVSENIELKLVFPHGASAGAEQGEGQTQADLQSEVARAASIDAEGVSNQGREEQSQQPLTVRRWSGEGSLLVEGLSFQNGKGEDKAVFTVGETVTLALDVRATRNGKLPLVVGVVVYTLDGITVSQNISPGYELDVHSQEIVRISLDYPALNLRNGRYVISISLHKDLDPHHPELTERYDLVAQSYQFEIVGNPPLRSGLVELPAQWRR